MKQVLRAFAMLLCASMGAAWAARPEVVDLPTRPGVSERILVEQPDRAPTAVLILMTGGTGRLGVLDNGSLRNGGNFLVRSRELSPELAAAYLKHYADRTAGQPSPYHRAAANALGELTGRKAAPTAKAWREALAAR